MNNNKNIKCFNLDDSSFIDVNIDDGTICHMNCSPTCDIKIVIEEYNDIFDVVFENQFIKFRVKIIKFDYLKLLPMCFVCIHINKKVYTLEELFLLMNKKIDEQLLKSNYNRIDFTNM